MRKTHGMSHTRLHNIWLGMRWAMRRSVLYKQNYEVFENGEVFSTLTHRFLKGGCFSNGYEFVVLNIDGKSKNIMRHRLVARLFIPNINGKPCINHIDGNKKNNHVSNLEWCSHSENTRHAIMTGAIDKVCKIQRAVKVTHIQTRVVFEFETMKQCGEFFGFTKCWLVNYQKKHGNPCVYKNYLIESSTQRGSV